MSEAPPLRIALASCSDYPEGFGGEALLLDALAERGAETTWRVWNDPAVDWGEVDLVVVRCTWDYPDHLDEFRAWVQDVAMRATLVNPPRLILGNLHKGYLALMSGEAVPTVVVPAGMTINLSGLGWSSIVVKPAVAVGGNGAVRGARQEDLDGLTLAADGGVDAVVQPYIDSVEHEGEISLICIAGEPSHAVLKKPAPGEFRIHEEHGGTAERVPVEPDLAGVTRRALDRLPSMPLIARVDMLRHRGRLLISELELIEPYLWLELAPDAAGRLADALVGQIRPPADDFRF